MLRGRKRNEVRCQPIEISLVNPLISFISNETLGGKSTSLILFTYSAISKFLKLTRPSSLAFHTP